MDEGVLVQPPVEPQSTRNLRALWLKKEDGGRCLLLLQLWSRRISLRAKWDALVWWRNELQRDYFKQPVELKCLCLLSLHHGASSILFRQCGGWGVVVVRGWGVHTHPDKAANSIKTGLNRFFITTLSSSAAPSMPFIMQILNGICLIYQARRCLKKEERKRREKGEEGPLRGNIINKALSQTFLLQMRRENNKEETLMPKTFSINLTF